MSNFLLGNKVEVITGVGLPNAIGIVRGKVTGIDAYIVATKTKVFNSLLAKSIYQYNILKWGRPNRNLSLDWGQFSGNANEFIVSGSKIQELNE